MTETNAENGGRPLHQLIPFLIPLSLALAGNAYATVVASTAWGKMHGEPLLFAALMSWVIVSFLMYRELTSERARLSGASRYWLVCVFAACTGALCALDTSRGFTFLEALFGAAIVASCCIEATGIPLTHVPGRILFLATGQVVCIAAALMVSDIRLSLSGAGFAFLLTLLLLLSGVGREKDDRTE